MPNSGNARRKRAEPPCAPIAPGIPAIQPMPDGFPELIAMRNELSERISRKRRSICATFEEASVTIAARLAAAPCGTIRTFLEASEAESPTSQRVRSLSVVLGLPAFAVAAALRNELSQMQRFYLIVQLDRLDALARALSAADPLRLEAPGPSSVRRPG